MSKDLSYEDWKKELNIWKTFTDLDTKRQGAAVFLTLTGKARETVRSEVDEKAIAKDDGVAKIIESLDKIFKKDNNQTAFTVFDSFIKYRRPANMTIEDYIAEFNLKYNKLKLHDMTLPEGVLAYALLTCANLSDQQQQLCRATVAKMTYQDMKVTIEKVVTKILSSDPLVKDYPFYTEYEGHSSQDYFQDPYYSYESTDSYDIPEAETHPDEPPATQLPPEDTYYQNNPYRGRGNGQSYRPQGYSRGRGSTRPPMRHSSNTTRPTLNPVDSFGNPRPCSFCHSVYHWLEKCPDAPDSVKGGRGRAGSDMSRPPRRPGSGGQPWRKL